MHVTILIFGYLGAWLLVAGPVFQAALELQERALNPNDFGNVFSSTPAPRPVAGWWWLLPPAVFVIRRVRRRRYLQQVMASLPAEQRTELLQFTGKAIGWMIVALGAFFIALKETWELADGVEWGVLGFLLLAAGALALGVLHTVVRMRIGRTGAVVG